MYKFTKTYPKRQQTQSKYPRKNPFKLKISPTSPTLSQNDLVF